MLCFIITGWRTYLCFAAGCLQLSSAAFGFEIFDVAREIGIGSGLGIKKPRWASDMVTGADPPQAMREFRDWRCNSGHVDCGDERLVR